MADQNYDPWNPETKESGNESENADENHYIENKETQSQTSIEGADINWTQLYHSVLSMPDSNDEEMLKKYKTLTQLHNDFISVAETVGKLIIGERSIDISQKSLRACVRDKMGIAVRK